MTGSPSGLSYQCACVDVGHSPLPSDFNQANWPGTKHWAGRRRGEKTTERRSLTADSVQKNVGE